MTVLGCRVDTRSKRRVLVAATYGSYIVLCAFGLSAGRSGAALAISIALTGIAGSVLFAGWLALAESERHFKSSEDQADGASRNERHTQLRHRSFVQAYGIITAVVCAACAYWSVAPNAGLWLPSPEYNKRMLFGLIFVAASLPSAIQAWITPDTGRDAWNR